jgi:hypothetical protein
MCESADHIQLASGKKIHYNKCPNYILRKKISIIEFVELGKKAKLAGREGFNLTTIHLFWNWKKLALDPNYARQIVNESKKLDYGLLCSDFKIVLQACYDTLSKVALPGDIDDEIVATSEIKERELVTA